MKSEGLFSYWLDRIELIVGTNDRRYTLDDFNYLLPDHLIAQEPVQPRDHSRLLVYDREKGQLTDDYFYNLPDHLPDDSTLVVNNSRVEKCRLLFDGGKKELFILDVLDDQRVEAMVRPGKRFKAGNRVQLAEGIKADVLAVQTDGVRVLRLSHPVDHPVLNPFKSTPFPPYIKQNETLSPLYQTVFAQEEGSKAAPTAGLHFTDSLIDRLKSAGHSWQEITLHVGLGTFAPVKSTRIEDHKMHSEWYRLDERTSNALNRSQHITAVGTTSVRVLESVHRNREQFEPGSGDTDIFITPGYRFRAVDAIITKFHLPKSTLLMLVSAFVGLEETRAIYRHAVENEYRFYSFGDAMLLK